MSANISNPALRLEAAIRSPRRANLPALMPYLTAGYPDRASFRRILAGVADVADVIEVGVPFSDPMADGVTIQKTSAVALAGGTTLRTILDDLDAVPTATPKVLMSYLNPLLAYGLESLVADAASVGICGFIVPDLPHEEAGLLREPASRAGLAVIPLVTPVTPLPRLQTLCAGQGGFVYAVTLNGVTGSALPSDVGQRLDLVRSISPRPVCAGFGIRTHADVSRLAAHADGVVVGSALLQALGRGEDPVQFLNTLMGDFQ